MDTLRARQHERCPSCSRYSYSNKEAYCLSCGHSENSPLWGALLMVGICFAVLALVGWLAS